MTDAFAQLSWIAILAAAVAHFVLGGVSFGAAGRARGQIRRDVRRC